MSDRTRAHVYVSGRVQGVYYRATTRDTAREEGVDGWVRNLDDGRVEAVFEGPEAAVREMVAWCETGSRAADVDGVDATYEEPEGLDGFDVRW
jgi:acylphosphatase